MTEDYALGMELKKEGFHCRYVREYLALGEDSERYAWLCLCRAAVPESL